MHGATPVLAVVVSLHGLIHLLGFAVGIGRSASLRFVTPISRRTGFAWLASAAALVGVGATLPLRFEAWWTFAALAALLSQALILSAWRDARFGALANVLLLAIAAARCGEQRFARETERIAEALVERAPPAPRSEAREADLEPLPPAVQRWLRRSGVLGRRRPRVVRLRQCGELQLAPGRGFQPVAATQVFTLSEPAFAWQARLPLYGAPLIGRDTYVAGSGRMPFTLAGVASIVDQADPKIDQGALLRFLGEMVWFPAGALEPYVSWAGDGDPEHEARASVSFGGASASALLRFDAQGRFGELRASRYFGGGESAVLTPWIVRASEWAVFDGVEVPVRGEVVWRLESRDFDFCR